MTPDEKISKLEHKIAVLEHRIASFIDKMEMLEKKIDESNNTKPIDVEILE